MHAHPTRRLLTILALLLAAAAVAYVLGMNLVAMRLSAQPNSEANLPAETALSKDIPAPQAQDYVPAQKGFQYLVSYTERGFTPATLSVNKGETVRFTNNSGGVLQLSLTDTAPLSQGQYFEYTFTTSGTVSDGGGNMVQVAVN